MSGAHWTAIGLMIGAIALQLQASPTWAVALSPASLGSVGLQISSILIALGAKSIFAPQPTPLDAVKAFSK